MCLQNFFSENSAFYFFSALLQANAAIFSLYAIFIIFKIQFIKSNIQAMENIISTSDAQGRTSFLERIDEFKKMKSDQQVEFIEENIKGPISDHLKAHFKQIGYCTSELRIIRGSIKYSSLILSSSLIVNTLGLFCSNYIHSFGNNIEFYILLGNVLFEILIIIILTKSIIDIVKS